MSAFLRSRLVQTTLVVAGVAVVLAVAQLVRVQHETGELRLTPSAAPPTIHVDGRTYDRGDRGSARRSLKDAQEIGATSGGGEIFGPRHKAVQGAPNAVVPTVLWVRDGATLWTYALSGGP